MLDEELQGVLGRVDEVAGPGVEEAVLDRDRQPPQADARAAVAQDVLEGGGLLDRVAVEDHLVLALEVVLQELHLGRERAQAGLQQDAHGSGGQVATAGLVVADRQVELGEHPRVVRGLVQGGDALAVGRGDGQADGGVEHVRLAADEDRHGPGPGVAPGATTAIALSMDIGPRPRLLGIGPATGALGV